MASSAKTSSEVAAAYPWTDTGAEPEVTPAKKKRGKETKAPKKCLREDCPFAASLTRNHGYCCQNCSRGAAHSKFCLKTVFAEASNPAAAGEPCDEEVIEVAASNLAMAGEPRDEDVFKEVASNPPANEEPSDEETAGTARGSSSKVNEATDGEAQKAKRLKKQGFADVSWALEVVQEPAAPVEVESEAEPEAGRRRRSRGPKRRRIVSDDWAGSTSATTGPTTAALSANAPAEPLEAGVGAEKAAGLPATPKRLGTSSEVTAAPVDVPQEALDRVAAVFGSASTGAVPTDLPAPLPTQEEPASTANPECKAAGQAKTRRSGFRFGSQAKASALWIKRQLQEMLETSEEAREARWSKVLADFELRLNKKLAESTDAGVVKIQENSMEDGHTFNRVAEDLRKGIDDMKRDLEARESTLSKLLGQFELELNNRLKSIDTSLEKIQEKSTEARESKLGKVLEAFELKLNNKLTSMDASAEARDSSWSKMLEEFEQKLNHKLESRDTALAKIDGMLAEVLAATAATKARLSDVHEGGPPSDALAHTESPADGAPKAADHEAANKDDSDFQDADAGEGTPTAEGASKAVVEEESAFEDSEMRETKPTAKAARKALAEAVAKEESAVEESETRKKKSKAKASRKALAEAVLEEESAVEDSELREKAPKTKAARKVLAKAVAEEESAVEDSQTRKKTPRAKALRKALAEAVAEEESAVEDSKMREKTPKAKASRKALAEAVANEESAVEDLELREKTPKAQASRKALAEAADDDDSVMQESDAEGTPTAKSASKAVAGEDTAVEDSERRDKTPTATAVRKALAKAVATPAVQPIDSEDDGASPSALAATPTAKPKVVLQGSDDGEDDDEESSSEDLNAPLPPYHDVPSRRYQGLRPGRLRPAIQAKSEEDSAMEDSEAGRRTAKAKSASKAADEESAIEDSETKKDTGTVKWEEPPPPPRVSPCKCGKEWRPHAHFCGYCGERLIYSEDEAVADEDDVPVVGSVGGTSKSSAQAPAALSVEEDAASESVESIPSEEDVATGSAGASTPAAKSKAAAGPSTGPVDSEDDDETAIAPATKPAAKVKEEDSDDEESSEDHKSYPPPRLQYRRPRRKRLLRR